MSTLKYLMDINKKIYKYFKYLINRKIYKHFKVSYKQENI